MNTRLRALVLPTEQEAAAASAKEGVVRMMEGAGSDISLSSGTSGSASVLRGVQ